MHPQALLELTTQLVRDVMRLDSPADSKLSSFFRHQRQLGQRERHALAETAYALLRRRLLYQHLAAHGPGSPERRLAVLAWAGEPGALNRALGPQEAAWLATQQAVDPQTLSDKLRHNLPDWLAGALRRQLPEDEFQSLATALNEPAPLDLRVNLLRGKRDAIAAQLQAAGLPNAATPWSPWGLRLQGKPALQKQLLFLDGSIEVQDEGSQLLALLLDAKRGEMVVDFCAGAGGKTLALGAAMRNTGRLYALDVAGHRLDALKPRLARSGLSNVHPVQIAHERDERIQRLAGKVDRVLVDAPCSGLGTLRRNPDLKWRQSPQAVREMAAKQQAILEAAAQLLKPGGRLVYATCSLLEDENERVAEGFDNAQPGWKALDAAELLGAAHVVNAQTLVKNGALRMWPHRHGTDGFFARAWQRP